MGSLHLEHKPVLVEEVLHYLAVREGGIYVDCTVGGGGHALRILQQIGSRGRLIGIDRDKKALLKAQEVLAPYSGQVTLIHKNFSEIKVVMEELEISQVDGFLFDLGVSAIQLLTPERGFSYNYDAPLDMRMDQEGTKVTAYDLVNKLSEEELAAIISRYGEEKWARRIARFIVDYRRKAPIATTGQLVEIIKAAIPAAARRRGPHPAKRTFQALRIAVNDELSSIVRGVEDAIPLLKPGGRIVVISFHSLEDRTVKNIFKKWESEKCLKILTRKPVVPTTGEVKNNPRARSAKLRAAERTLV
ncbi:MAG: Ribosomal RNA small subunit methyltransferase H [Thermoanaerobacterales bacterium 50_218]|nr:MAG: Ribosomal RNA small subunit methyltransferase H [Thermoanaerobacterales bacterium 50_218]HAA90422.1 16S rRNA (cytosine(1402)-N(4))-methyltransferase [Peptococcaceae bacterium]